MTPELLNIIINGGAFALLAVVLWQVKLQLDKIYDQQNELINKLVDATIDNRKDIHAVREQVEENTSLIRKD